MRNLFLISMVIMCVIIACNQSSNKTMKENNISNSLEDNSIVNVYYFHGKQRCKTCIAVGNVTQESIEKNFSGNKKIRFIEINTADGANEHLVEKYDVSWNALIIAKGEKYEDITEDAFAVAVGNPEKLSKHIVSIVESMLE